LVTLTLLLTVSSARSNSSHQDLAAFIEAVIDGRDATLGILAPTDREELADLYQANHNGPLWSDEQGRPTDNAHDGLQLLRHAADDALDPADYYQGVLARLQSSVKAVPSSPAVLARFDVVLSAAMLRLVRHAHLGRVDPRTIGFRLDVRRDQHDFGLILRGAIAERRVANVVADLSPRLVQYRLLRAMLPRYRSLAADPTLVAPQAISRVIHPGDPFADAGALQHVLMALGDLPANEPALSEQARYEGAVVEGVKRFQLRHGLDSDGILGKSTIAALRVPLTWRVRQIELALERLRWLPDLGDQRLIALNTPMFRLWAWNRVPPSGKPLFGMDVIVGRALRTQTPVFVADMREVIFRPYWNVPRSILRHEVLPKIERDPEYLFHEDMEIVRGAADNATRVDLTTDALTGLKQGVLRVRQRPGPKNALGLVKFVFPNSEDVYMHGTPAQALFARSRRDFSHGCVRLADPVGLAEWVLEDDPEWGRDRIVAAMTGTETIHVKLPSPIKVILFYTTATVMPEDGTIRFAEDIYRHDARLDRALATEQGGQ
jgi:murein L,D-transpeptidase YcbB/YkuD